MTTQLTIPRLEMSMTEGVLTDGAEVKEGDPIYSLETGKSIQEILAPASGRLTHKAKVGETYPVGADMGEIV